MKFTNLLTIITLLLLAGSASAFHPLFSGPWLKSNPASHGPISPWLQTKTDSLRHPCLSVIKGQKGQRGWLGREKQRH